MSTASKRAKKSPGSIGSTRTKGAHYLNRTSPSARTQLELRTLQSLRTIFGSTRTHDIELRRSAGISGSQLWALSEIATSTQSKGITVNALSVQMALHQTTTSNLINSLVERGLIRRERDDADQRVVHLLATAQGKQTLQQTSGPHAGLHVDALRRLEASQLLRLFESLQSLITIMQRTAETAAGETLMGE